MVLSSRRDSHLSDRRLGIPVSKSKVALVDTGAEVSLLSEEIYKEIQRVKRQVVPLEETRVSLSTANGGKLDVLGACNVKIPGLPIHKYTIVRKLQCQILLGADFCNRHGVIVDFRNHRIKVDQDWRSAKTTRINGVFSVPKITDYSALLAKYPEVMAGKSQLGTAKGVEMSIKTTGPPIKQRAYRLPLVKRQAVEEQVNALKEQGIISPSMSEWASPVVIVPKKDGKFRLCIDYRKLNSVTVKDSHPIPNIRDIFDQLQGASYFSLIDLQQGYHQVRLAKDSRAKTAFSCHLGLFEYNRMPFGLTNAPSMFQRYMNIVLQGLIGRGCLVYIDDIVVYGKTKQEHDKNLEAVLERLKKYQLQSKPSKCTFGVRSIKLLGHVIDQRGIHMDKEKGKAIAKMDPPRDETEVKRFLGATGYYRDLIPGYARKAAPLSELTRKNEKFVMNKRRLEAFNTLKRDLLSDHCVAFPDINKPYNLYTDACDYAMGAVLTQTDEKTGKEKAVYYISHQFNDVQRRWATIEKEAYALVYAVEKLRPYLLGCPGIFAYTDHKPLLCLFTQQMRNTKIQRWSILLSEFRVKISYIKGENNVKADFLSRLRQDVGEDLGINVVDAEHSIHYPKPLPYEEDAALEVLRFDDIPTAELRQQQASNIPVDERESQFNVNLGGVICSIRPPSENAEVRPRIILPPKYRSQVILKAHEEVGHAASARTLRRLQEAYVWNGMNKDVVEFINRCQICIVHRKKREHVAMGEGPMPAIPDQVVALDLIGPFVRDANDNKFAMTVIDHCTGWVEAYPLRYKSNAEVLNAFAERYLPYHSTPHVVITDNGREFSSDEWRNYFKKHKIRHQLTTPYHPQSNGKVERMNRTLKEMLGRLSNNNLSRWSQVMPECVKIINSTPTRATGYSPFLLQTGRDPRLAVSANIQQDIGTDAGDRSDWITKAIRDAKMHQAKLRTYNRQRIDKKANAGDLKIGDNVVVFVDVPGTHTTRWDPGYRIVRVRGNTVWVTHSERGGRKPLHRTKVKLVDPDLAWDGIAPRPTRHEIRKNTRGRNFQSDALRGKAPTAGGSSDPPVVRKRGRPPKNSQNPITFKGNPVGPNRDELFPRVMLERLPESFQNGVQNAQFNPHVVDVRPKVQSPGPLKRPSDTVERQDMVKRPRGRPRKHARTPASTHDSSSNNDRIAECPKESSDFQAKEYDTTQADGQFPGTVENGTSAEEAVSEGNSESLRSELRAGGRYNLRSAPSAPDRFQS